MIPQLVDISAIFVLGIRQMRRIHALIKYNVTCTFFICLNRTDLRIKFSITCTLFSYSISPYTK